MEKSLPKPPPPPSGAVDKGSSPSSSRSSSRPSNPSKPSKRQAELAALRLHHGLLLLEQQMIQQKLRQLDNMSDSTLEDELAEIRCDYMYRTSCNGCLNAIVTATANTTTMSIIKPGSMEHLQTEQQDTTGENDSDLVEMPAPPSRSVSPLMDVEATETTSLSSPLDTSKQLKEKRQVRFARLVTAYM